MASSTSSSPKSEPSESSDPEMDALAFAMGKNTLSDDTSTATDLRIKSNGKPSCQGYTVEYKLCDRDGINVVRFKKGIGLYCFTHDPSNSEQQCLAWNRKGDRQCANICSMKKGEVHEDGRSICNHHHTAGAKLIDSTYYPPHRANKKK